jgi:hypothetical protein
MTRWVQSLVCSAARALRRFLEPLPERPACGARSGMAWCQLEPGHHDRPGQELHEDWLNGVPVRWGSGPPGK